MNVKDIVKKYLLENGFDGLCNDDCGCGCEDLMPCDFSIIQCKPAKKFECKISCEKFDDCCGELGVVCYRSEQ